MLKYKRKILSFIMFMSVFLYLAFAITGLLKDINEKKRNDQELRTKIQEQEKTHEQLLEEKNLIESLDPEYMEALARELGMLKEDEILFEERRD